MGKVINDTLNKWDSFVIKAFQNESFSSVFHKSKVTDRSYYDLLCNDSFFHLVARNTPKQSIEVYIKDNVPFYCFVLNHLDILNKNINEEFDFYTQMQNKKIINTES